MREQISREKELGKVVGYCPSCSVPVSEKELNHHCTRCDKILREHNLLSDPFMPTTTARKQSSADLLKAGMDSKLQEKAQERKDNAKEKK